MAVYIGKITLADADTIMNLNNTIFDDLIKYNKSYIEKLCTERKGFIVGLDGTIVGYVLCDNCYNDITKSTVLTIMSIGVLEAYRSNGFGRMLLKAVIDLYKKSDLYLHVRETNITAQKLYKSEGFVSMGTVPKFYKLPTGNEDAYCMVRFYEIGDMLKKF
jgi:ribosomal protein S18 acetylase RimI-like enzyme